MAKAIDLDGLQTIKEWSEETFVKDEDISAPAKKISVVLPVSWTGAASPYSQVITIQGATASSKIDLQPSAAVLSQMQADGTTALWIENNNGTLTAYAMDAAPTAILTVQATIMEVES
jgi:hypothetical protein